jgi:hypothetical protein
MPVDIGSFITSEFLEWRKQAHKNLVQVRAEYVTPISCAGSLSSSTMPCAIFIGLASYLRPYHSLHKHIYSKTLWSSHSQSIFDALSRRFAPWFVVY